MKRRILKEDYPQGFSFDELNNIKTIKERLMYAAKYFGRPKLGSSRATYFIDNEKVLKIAKNKKGLEQNRTEIDIAKQSWYSEVVVQIFNYDDEDYSYAEMERASRLKDVKIFESVFNGHSLEEVKLIALYRYSPQYYGKNKPDYLEEIDNKLSDESQFYYELLDMLGSYDLHILDVFKLDSWGIVIRDGVPHPVLIDFGLNNRTWRDFY